MMSPSLLLKNYELVLMPNDCYPGKNSLDINIEPGEGQFHLYLGEGHSLFYSAKAPKGNKVTAIKNQGQKILRSLPPKILNIKLPQFPIMYRVKTFAGKVITGRISELALRQQLGERYNAFSKVLEKQDHKELQKFMNDILQINAVKNHMLSSDNDLILTDLQAKIRDEYEIAQQWEKHDDLPASLDKYLQISHLITLFYKKKKNVETTNAYQWVGVSGSTPMMSVMQSDMLILQKKDENIVLYWLDNGKILSQAFSAKDEEVIAIINHKNLPKVGEKIKNLNLINAITLKYKSAAQIAIIAQEVEKTLIKINSLINKVYIENKLYLFISKPEADLAEEASFLAYLHNILPEDLAFNMGNISLDKSITEFTSDSLQYLEKYMDNPAIAYYLGNYYAHKKMDVTKALTFINKNINLLKNKPGQYPLLRKWLTRDLINLGTYYCTPEEQRFSCYQRSLILSPSKFIFEVVKEFYEDKFSGSIQEKHGKLISLYQDFWLSLSKSNIPNSLEISQDFLTHLHKYIANISDKNSSYHNMCYMLGNLSYCLGIYLRYKNPQVVDEISNCFITAGENGYLHGYYQLAIQCHNEETLAGRLEELNFYTKILENIDQHSTSDIKNINAELKSNIEGTLRNYALKKLCQENKEEAKHVGRAAQVYCKYFPEKKSTISVIHKNINNLVKSKYLSAPEKSSTAKMISLLGLNQVNSILTVSTHDKKSEVNDPTYVSLAPYIPMSLSVGTDNLLGAEVEGENSAVATSRLLSPAAAPILSYQLIPGGSQNNRQNLLDFGIFQVDLSEEECTNPHSYSITYNPNL